MSNNQYIRWTLEVCRQEYDGQLFEFSRLAGGAL